MPIVEAEIAYPLHVKQGRTRYRKEAWFLNDDNGMCIACTYDEERAALFRVLARDTQTALPAREEVPRPIRRTFTYQVFHYSIGGRRECIPPLPKTIRVEDEKLRMGEYVEFGEWAPNPPCLWQVIEVEYPEDVGLGILCVRLLEPTRLTRPRKAEIVQ